MILTCPASRSSSRPGKLQVTPRGRDFRHPQGWAYSVPRKNNLPQFVVLGIVTVLYWFVLSLIQNFDRPFTGMLALEPTSMQKTAWDIGQDYATTYNSEPPCNGRGQPR
jgi:hypothetical protein